MSDPRQSHSPRIYTRTVDAVALAVLLATLVFRLIHVGDARFAGDEAWLYQQAGHVAALETFPVYGTHITGSFVRVPGGLYHLIMALPLIFTNDPLAPMVLTVVLGVLGLGLGYLVFRREYGHTGALGALSLAAFNPFSVLFGDRHWNPNILIPIGFLWLSIVVRALRGKGRLTWMWLAALLVISPQLHLSCVQLALVTLTTVLIARPGGFRIGHVLAGTGLGAATYIPYLVWDGLNGFGNTVALFSHVAGSAASPIEAVRAAYYMPLYGAGEYTYVIAKGFWFPMTEWGFYEGRGLSMMRDFLGIPTASGWIMAGSLCVALLVSVSGHAGLLSAQVVRLVRRGREAVELDPLATLAVVNLPILMASMLLSGKAFYPHYSIVVLPLALVPAAWLISRASRPTFLIAAAPLLALVMLTHGTLTAWVYERDEAPVSSNVFVETAGVILQDSHGAGVDIRIPLPRTRVGTYPIRVLAREYYGAGIVEDPKSRTRYTIVPPGHQAAKRAVRVWEVGPMWLVKTVGR